MMSYLYRAVQKACWFLDLNRWMVPKLGLSKVNYSSNHRGLILIQIDGFSHSHLQKALDEKYLPFLKKLLNEEHYQDWHHYSGIPSSTPSIQAELFYGVKQYAPAFMYRDRQTGKVFSFYDYRTASEVETRLQFERQGLLQQGSSYNNIFRGGSEENAHFCVASIGWSAFFRAFRPSILTLFILMNILSFFRMIFFLVIEFFLAAFDFVRGTIKGFGLQEELKFILSRLVVTIGFREFSVLGTKLDIIRGLPVIHVNFFGYDDQAHRRGPGSRFAYWALPGIDDAIRRIWKAAQNSVARDYELWIYSDHGQEEVVPYLIENGETIEKAVVDLFHHMMPGESFEFQKNDFEGPVSCRTFSPISYPSEPPGIFVAAQGPVGFIYPHRPLSFAEKENIARGLIERKKIPLVLTVIDQVVYAFTQEGKHRFPEEAEKIIEADHPYQKEVMEELVNLVKHPDAGEFVISGWRKGKKPMSFPYEYGSHAGPGPCETDGFALLPRDIRVISSEKKYLRPSVLRQTALGYLKGDARVFFERNTINDRVRDATLRIMTYNVHSCIGMDGKPSPERIARVIARHDPDIIALQELDSGRSRTQMLDQAKMIAEFLEIEHHFHAVRMMEEEMFGNAIFSRYPMEVIYAGSLPRSFKHALFEPRGALWAQIQYAGIPIQIINTHLSLWSREQKKQVATLCGKDWLELALNHKNVILCGDFNAFPNSATCRLISHKLQDVQLKVDCHKPRNTWFGHFPLGRIDHIFISQPIKVKKVEVPSSRLEKVASDHLPLIADLKISLG